MFFWKSHHVQYTLKNVHKKFPVTPTDKTNDNIAYICKQFYQEVLSKEHAISKNWTHKKFWIMQMQWFYWTCHKIIFIIASPVSSLKAFSKSITYIIKL